MIGGGNPIKILANNFLDIDGSFHEYFSGIGKSFVINFYWFYIIHMLHTFSNTFFLFFVQVLVI